MNRPVHETAMAEAKCPGGKVSKWWNVHKFR